MLRSGYVRMRAVMCVRVYRYGWHVDMMKGFYTRDSFSRYLLCVCGYFTRRLCGLELLGLVGGLILSLGL